MAGYKTVLAHTGTPGKVRLLRDSANVLYAFIANADKGSTPIDIYRSFDSGRSWTLWTTPAGEDNFIEPMFDHLDRLFLGRNQDGGVQIPKLFFDAGSGWNVLHQFTNLNPATNARFAVDTYHRTGGASGLVGFARFYGCFNYQPGGSGAFNALISDTAGTIDARVDTIGGQGPGNGNSQFDLQAIVAPGGATYFVWVETGSEGSAFAKQRVEGSFPISLTARVKVSDASHTVAAIESLSVDPLTGFPGILYFRAGGANELWLAELTSDGTWSRVKVWDGSTDFDHNQKRASLSYDSQGSVYVHAYPLISSVEEPHLFYQLRALGDAPAGTFRLLRLSGAASANVSTRGSMLDDTGYAVRGGDLMPSTNFQAAVTLTWIRAAAAALSASELYYIEQNEYPGVGVPNYPNILQPVDGEEPPRVEPDLDLPSIVLTGEGAAATTYPFVPDKVYEEEIEDPRSLLRTELGDVRGFPLYAAGRNRLVLRQEVLTRTEWEGTLKPFIEARYDDLKPFDVALPPSGGTTIRVFPIRGRYSFRRVGPDQFRTEMTVLESL